MPFKDTNRVIYKKNPLIEVVCQLRFPRILSINEKLPAVFQERIRGEYPLFEVANEHQQRVSIEATGENVAPVPRITQSEVIKNYKFTSADGIWHINLTSTFLALSTSAYTTWDDFLSRLQEPLNALIEIYKPAFFERVGLRYVDAFRRSVLGISDVPWGELIQPFALGFLSNEDIKDDIRGFSSVTEIDIGDGAMARVNTALAYVGNANIGSEAGQSELSYIVDSDMYYGKKSIEDTKETLDKLHGTASKLIHAVITDKLHEAMEPEEK